MSHAAAATAIPLRVPAIVLILGAALALRLAGLNHAPLWMDEAATLGFAQLPWHELFGGIGRLETNPPGFYVLMKLWTAVAGTSDLALRLPSALFGLAGVAAIWALARDAFGARAAAWTAALMAIQAHHLDHSREARTYALLLLVVAVACLLARRVAMGRWRAAAPLAAACGAALLLHNTAPVALLCVFAYAAVVALGAGGWKALGVLAASGLAGLALGSPALLALAHQAADGANSASWIPTPDTVLTTQIALSVFAAPLQGFRDMGPAAVGSFFLLAALVVAVALAWGLARARRNADAAGMLLALAVAVLTLHGLSQFVPVLLERTLVFALVFFVPLLGGALAALAWPGRTAVLAALLAAQAPALVLAYAPARHGEDWRTLAATLQGEHAATGWPVLMLGGFEALALERYLPQNDPARAAASLTPAIGARLTTAVTAAMTAATPLPPAATAPALCAALGQAVGVLLVLRASAVLPETRPRAESLLRAAGGHAEPPVPAELGPERLRVERWPGACAARR